MIEIQCAQCGATQQFADNELEPEIFETVEREQGPQRGYEGTISTVCAECDSELEVTFVFWEYPLSIFNESSVDAEGCAVLSEPDYTSYIPPLN